MDLRCCFDDIYPGGGLVGGLPTEMGGRGANTSVGRCFRFSRRIRYVIIMAATPRIRTPPTAPPIIGPRSMLFVVEVVAAFVDVI